MRMGARGSPGSRSTSAIDLPAYGSMEADGLATDNTKFYVSSSFAPDFVNCLVNAKASSVFVVNFYDLVTRPEPRFLVGET